MTLEEKLHEAAKRGLTHLALYPVPSVDQKTIYWTATAAPSTQHHYVRSTQLDPVAALHQVLDELPKAKNRAKKSDAITAAVTEPQQEDLTTWLPKT